MPDQLALPTPPWTIGVEATREAAPRWGAKADVHFIRRGLDLQKRDRLANDKWVLLRTYLCTRQPKQKAEFLNSNGIIQQVSGAHVIGLESKERAIGTVRRLSKSLALGLCEGGQRPSGGGRIQLRIGGMVHEAVDSRLPIAHSLRTKTTLTAS